MGMQVVTQERLDRLPLWAQAHIEDLERRVHRMEREAADLRAAMDGEVAPDTRVQVRHFTTRPDLALDDDAQVQFKVGADPRRDEYVNVYLEHGNERLTISGGRRIVIEPNASNTVHIRLKG